MKITKRIKRMNAAYLISNNWRIWKRLPRLAKFAAETFPVSVGIAVEKRKQILGH